VYRRSYRTSSARIRHHRPRPADPVLAAHEKLAESVVGRATPTSRNSATRGSGAGRVAGVVPLDLDDGSVADDRTGRLLRRDLGHERSGGDVRRAPDVDTRVLFYRFFPTFSLTRGSRRRPDLVAVARRHDAGARARAGPVWHLVPVNEWAQPIILGLAPARRCGAMTTARGFLDPRFRACAAFYVGLFRDSLAAPISTCRSPTCISRSRTASSRCSSLARGMSGMPATPASDAPGRWATAPCRPPMPSPACRQAHATPRRPASRWRVGPASWCSAAPRTPTPRGVHRVPVGFDAPGSLLRPDG